MMPEYAARVCPDGREQTVRAHTYGVCERARTDAELLGAPSVTRLVCLLHDMGKNTAYSDLYQHTVGAGGRWGRDKPIHSHAGAKLIYDSYFQRKELYAKLLSELAEAVIMSHHGMFDCLKNADTGGGFNGLLKKIQNDKYDFDEARELLFSQITAEKELNEIFDRAVSEIKSLCEAVQKMTAKKDEFFFYLSMIYRVLLSILVNADHSDAAEFSSGEQVISSYGDTLLWQRYGEYLEKRLSEFQIKTPLQSARSEISQKLLERSESECKIVRLSVPTGGGKTLGSLRYAVNYAKRFGKSRIIYAAPFNSILEQNSAEYRKFLPDGAELLEHFGDIVQYEKNETNYRYYTENWGSPVIATSMVQFLNTLFLGKISSVRRMRGLIDSVIILDEIQSVPVECVSVFNLALNFLAEVCHCTIILCSATQPTFESEIKHKIRLSEHSELLENRSDYTERFRRTKITDSMKPEGYTYEETADFALVLAQASKSVLLIVNTKEASKTVYSIIKERLSDSPAQEEFVVFHLSTHMCPAHRKAALAELKSCLNRGDRKVICVSTQLIEAGVDISFETVVRSLTGLDSIIQSAGRCNRNKETDLGSVHVINISEENISRIKTIKIGAAITRRLLEAMRKNPSLFNGDISSEEAVTKYYLDFFAESENELDYKVLTDDTKTTVFRLLSDNADLKNRAKAFRDNNLNIFFNQSFKTAGESFKVIEDYANTVVVPYGEGKELINRLCSGRPVLYRGDMLRAMQQYSVGLSERQCGDRVVKNGETGILILKDGYYNSEYGFDPEGETETLMF